MATLKSFARRFPGASVINDRAIIIPHNHTVEILSGGRTVVKVNAHRGAPEPSLRFSVPKVMMPQFLDWLERGLNENELPPSGNYLPSGSSVLAGTDWETGQRLPSIEVS